MKVGAIWAIIRRTGAHTTRWFWPARGREIPFQPGATASSSIRPPPSTAPPIVRRPQLAAVPVVAPVEPAPSLPPETVSSRRVALRRNAVFDLFDAAALGPPPTMVWRFVASDDVGADVDRFLRTTGADRDLGVLDALLRAERGLRRAEASVATAWLADLLSGDPSRFAAAATAACHQPGPRLTDHWPADLVPRSLTGQPTENDHTEAIAEALADHADLRRSLRDRWPDAWSTGVQGERLSTALTQFELAEVAAVAALADGIDPTPSLVTINAVNVELAVQLAAACGDTPAVSLKKVDQPRPGAAIAAAPDWVAAMTAWRSLRWTYHPDRPGLDAQEQARRRQCCDDADRVLARRERLGAVGTP